MISYDEMPTGVCARDGNVKSYVGLSESRCKSICDGDITCEVYALKHSEWCEIYQHCKWQNIGELSGRRGGRYFRKNQRLGERLARAILDESLNTLKNQIDDMFPKRRNVSKGEPANVSQIG